ncbi:hypothetical protein [Deinococcus humi]|uniref:Uncharacterized protein n=1 Tax=Deinococcus humi TaxID=662880 RepID=A0A7W8NHJ3_9DEIO|nr:hypothetical protein [Deinococcus humi]MBB5365940.1 hypothetical protein [Deinococcus humi]GGO40339.1 hypothetical protein GCM10008949_49760 [Deinococcus humi]
MGDLPTVMFYGFFPGGVLEHQVDADWWNRTEGLWEKAEQAGAEQRKARASQDWEAFQDKMREILPHDEEFRHIALLPRPPITELRNRVDQVFPGHRHIGLYVILNELVKGIKAEEKRKKAEERQRNKAK